MNLLNLIALCLIAARLSLHLFIPSGIPPGGWFRLSVRPYIEVQIVHPQALAPRVGVGRIG